MQTKHLVFTGKDVFRTAMRIRVTDLNYGNHLGNDRLLAFAHEARYRWLQSMQLSELDIGGCGIVVADAVIRFLAQGFAGDQIEIDIAIDNIGGSSFDLYYQMHKENGQTLALIKTKIVAFDYNRQKPVLVPSTFKDFFDD
jgi:acyl-CoA thioester hydrolase